MVARPGPTAIQFFDQAPTTMNASQIDGAEFVAQKTLKDFERGKLCSIPVGRRCALLRVRQDPNKSAQ